MDSVYKIFYAHRENEQSKLIDLEFNSVSEIFKNIDSVISGCLKEINKAKTDSSKVTIATDLHYTTALYLKDKKSPTASVINSLLFDLDSIDTSRADEYIDTFSVLTGVPKSSLGVISSGGGLHIWLELNTPIRATDQNFYVKYKNLCTQLDKGLGAFDLLYTHRTADGKKKITHFDAHVFDKNKTLRLPNTINTKYDPPRECKIIQYANTAVDFDNFCDKVSESVAKLYNEKGIISYQDGSVDGFAVQQGCKFLQHFSVNQNEQNFETWHALGLIYLNLYEDKDEGINAFMEASKDYPTFDDNEFLNKCNSIIASGHKSYGCEKISGMWSGCQSCPHFGKVRSPLYIQGENFIASEKDGFWVQVGTPEKPKYIVDNEGVWKKYRIGKTLAFNSEENIFLSLDTERGLWDLKTDRGLSSFKEGLKYFFQQNVKKPYNKSDLNKEKNAFADYVIHEKKNVTFKDIEASRFIENSLIFNNGIYNYITGEKVGDENTHFVTTKLPYDYDPSVEIPAIWINFLDQAFQGNKNLIDQLGYVFAHVLSKDVKHQNFHYWFGVGGTGKSTVADVLRSLVGSNNTSSVNASNFTAEEKLFPLADSFVNIQNEVNFNKMPDINKDALKNLSAGGEFSHRKLYSDPTKTINRCKLLFTSNEPFNLKNDDRALTRRIRVLPFNYIVPESKLDSNLVNKLTDKKVLAGIMNWSIGYLKKLNEMDVFPNPPECRAYVESFKNESNPVNIFLDHECVLTPKDLNGSVDKVYIYASDLFFIFKLIARSVGFKYIDSQYKDSKKFLAEMKKVYRNKTGVDVSLGTLKGYSVVRGISFDFEKFEFETDVLMSPEEMRRFSKCKNWFIARADKLKPFTKYTGEEYSKSFETNADF